MALEEAQDLFYYGNQVRQGGDVKGSLAYYRQALQIFQKEADEKWTADTYLELGNTYADLGDPAQATRHYQYALSSYEEMDDLIGEGYSLTGLGVVWERRDEFDEARSYYGQAIQKFREAKDFERADTVLTLMAGTYQPQGGLEDYLEDYSEAPDVHSHIEEEESTHYMNKVTGMVHKKRRELSSTRLYAITAILYLIGFVIAELLTTYVNKSWGLGAHTILLFALIINSSLVESQRFANLLRALIAVPIIRIIGLSMPLIQIKPFFWFPIVAIPLFAAAIAIMRSQKMNWKDVGLTWQGLPLQIIIGLFGVFLGIVEFLILRPDPLLPVLNPLALLGGFLVILISTGLAEELLFRGIIQNNAQQIFTPLFALIFTALVFTSMHIGWQSLTDYLFVFCVAVIYGVIFYKTRNIVGITLNHGLSNTMLFLVLPFYVVNINAFWPF